jgi:hypothetical protein
MMKQYEIIRLCGEQFTLGTEYVRYMSRRKTGWFCWNAVWETLMIRNTSGALVLAMGPKGDKNNVKLVRRLRTEMIMTLKWGTDEAI